MATYSEGQLNFSFPDDYKVIKFDSTNFYLKTFDSYMPEGKGLDFIAYSGSQFIMLEVKDFSADKHSNVWRTRTDTAIVNIDNANIDTPIKANNYSVRESLDIEVAKKVASSMSCLLGANSTANVSEADELKPFLKELVKSKFSLGNSDIVIILFVEGILESKTRTKKMIMKRLQDKIKEKLKWLNCKVSVFDSETCNNKYVIVTSA